MKDVREILKKRPLLFDGGMGTYYKAKPGQECEQANLLDPDGILTVHRAYLEAGYCMAAWAHIIRQSPAQKALWPQQDCTDGIWEAGYCIGKHWWNHGFATEALKAAVNYWFENTDGGWLTCCHAKENPASGRVMEKAGFLYHHDAIDHKFDGTPVECRSYLLTRERYNRKDLP